MQQSKTPQSKAPQSKTYESIYAVVKRIPKGRVATYGQVAALAGLHGHARQVGYALHALRGNESIPWHRVINAQGRCSVRSEPGFEQIQQQLLEAEGVVFRSGRASLEKFRWEPRPALRQRDERTPL
jgi:methylated-DNA-protein-cysteine methyltransferase-like protein